MAVYIFIFHPGDEETTIAARFELKFDDDLDALEAAQDLAEHYHVDYEIDVWTGERFVAQVKKRNEPLSVSHARSG